MEDGGQRKKVPSPHSWNLPRLDLQSEQERLFSKYKMYKDFLLGVTKKTKMYTITVFTVRSIIIGTFGKDCLRVPEH